MINETDVEKQRAMQALAATYLSKQAVQAAGLLDAEGVEQILQRHGAISTPIAERVQLDALINHLLSVQMMHEHFVATDVPKQARDRARELGWYAKEPMLANA